MNIKEFIAQMLTNTKNKIVDCVNEELENNQKKQMVDATITGWVQENTAYLSPVQSFVISKGLIPIIPTITQIVYDCLKQKVEGLTLNG